MCSRSLLNPDKRGVELQDTFFFVFVCVWYIVEFSLLLISYLFKDGITLSFISAPRITSNVVLSHSALLWILFRLNPCFLFLETNHIQTEDTTRHPKLQQTGLWVWTLQATWRPLLLSPCHLWQNYRQKDWAVRRHAWRHVVCVRGRGTLGGWRRMWCHCMTGILPLPDICCRQAPRKAGGSTAVAVKYANC